METNRFLERYRQGSQILHSVHNMLNDVVNKKDINNLQSHLSRIQGAPGKNGDYYDPTSADSYPGDKKRERGFVPSKLSRLREEENELQQKWEMYCQQQLNIGNLKPKNMPPEMQERKEKLTAKVQVCQEEVSWLEQKLEDAMADIKAREHRPTNPRFWGAGRLHDNVLVEFCGWNVSKNSAGILAVDDPSSPFDGMEIWRVKSQVVNPMFHENRLRQRKEANAALAAERKRKEVPFPTPPTYRRETDTIEYPNYSNEVIRKLKLRDE